MSMLEMHAAAVANGSVYHEFLLKYRKNEQMVYGVVEGKDDPIFYQGLVEQFLPADWNVQLIRSGNRVNVINTFHSFDWARFSKERICFFIDRDLSLFQAEKDPDSPNIYITEKYSIENEAANFGTVNRLMHDILNICDISASESKVMSARFQENLVKFSDWFAPIMAQIILWKRQGLRPSLDNIVPKDIFRFHEGHIELQSDFLSLDARIKYAARKTGCVSSHLHEIEAALDEFRAKGGCQKFIRGKYILWFVVESTLEFHRKISSFSGAYKDPPKVKLTMGHANAMALVGTRVRCPETLAAFLKRNYISYINPLASEATVDRPNRAGFIVRFIGRICGWFVRK